MGRCYSLDLRGRVIEAIDGGMSARGAAARFSIGEATAIRWHRRWRDTGSYAPDRQGQRYGSKLDGHEAFIRALIDADVDIACYEIAERLAAERRVEVCPATVWYFLDKHDLTHKKRPGMRQNRNDLTSRRGARPGSTANSTSTRNG